MVTVISDI